MLPPLVPRNVAGPIQDPLPEYLLFPARSTQYLRQCNRKHYAPSHGRWLLPLANRQNCNALRVRSNPTPSDPLQRDSVQMRRKPLPKLAPGPMRAYPSAPLLVRLLPLSSLGWRRSLRETTQAQPHSTDSRRRAYRDLPQKTVRFPSARSEDHRWSIAALTRNRLKTRAWLPKHCRP